MATLTLTVRLYDPAEKEDPKRSASWITVQVERADLTLSAGDFAAKHVTPHLPELEQFKVKA